MPLEEEHWKSTGVISEVMARRTSKKATSEPAKPAAPAKPAQEQPGTGIHRAER